MKKFYVAVCCTLLLSGSWVVAQDEIAITPAAAPGGEVLTVAAEAVQPQGSVIVGEATPVAQEIFAGVPQTFTSAPFAAQGCNSCSAGVPQTFTSAPFAAQGVPQTFTSAPAISQGYMPVAYSSAPVAQDAACCGQPVAAPADCCSPAPAACCAPRQGFIAKQRAKMADRRASRSSSNCCNPCCN